MDALSQWAPLLYWVGGCLLAMAVVEKAWRLRTGHRLAFGAALLLTTGLFAVVLSGTISCPLRVHAHRYFPADLFFFLVLLGGVAAVAFDLLGRNRRVSRAIFLLALPVGFAGQGLLLGKVQPWGGLPSQLSPWNRDPAVPQFTETRSPGGQWVLPPTERKEEYYFVPFPGHAALSGEAFFWPVALCGFDLPIGVTVCNEVPFWLDDDGHVLVFPTINDNRLKRRPKQVRLPLRGDLKGAETLYILGLVAAYGGKRSHPFGPSLRVTVGYHEGEADVFDLYCCHYGYCEHHRREVEKENQEALRLPRGAHLDMRGLPLRPDRHPRRILLEDINPVDSPLVAALTAVRPLE